MQRVTEGSIVTLAIAGWIDVAQRTRLAGWASRARESADPIELEISVAPAVRSGRRRLTTILANRYRADHDPNGTLYEGRVGFDVDLHDLDVPAQTFLLDVRDALTDRRIPGAPQLIPAASFKPAGAGTVLTAIDNQPICRLPDDVTCCMPSRNGFYRLELSEAMSGIMICSPPRFSPGDARRLGVCLRRIAIDGQPVQLDSEYLAFGFHEVEGEAGGFWRWTDDAAFIGLGERCGSSAIELDVHGLPEEGFSEDGGT